MQSWLLAPKETRFFPETSCGGLIYMNGYVLDSGNRCGLWSRYNGGMAFWKSYGVQFSGLAGGALMSAMVLILSLVPEHLPVKVWLWFFMTIGFTIAAGWRVARERQKAITKLEEDLKMLRSTPILDGTCELSDIQHYPWADQTKMGAWLCLNLRIRHISGPEVGLDYAEVSVVDRNGQVHSAEEIVPRQFDAMQTLRRGQALSLQIGSAVLTLNEADVSTYAVAVVDALGRRHELQQEV
jgi:hypothetical protein